MCVCVCVKADHIFFQYAGLLFVSPSLSFNILPPHVLLFFGSLCLFVVQSFHFENCSSAVHVIGSQVILHVLHDTQTQ